MPSTWCVTMPQVVTGLSVVEQRHERRPSGVPGRGRGRPPARRGTRSQARSRTRPWRPRCCRSWRRAPAPRTTAPSRSAAPRASRSGRSLGHGIAQRVPARRHLVDRRLVVPLTVPREVEEGRRQRSPHAMTTAVTTAAATDAAFVRPSRRPNHHAADERRHGRDRRERAGDAEAEREARDHAEVERSRASTGAPRRHSTPLALTRRFVRECHRCRVQPSPPWERTLDELRRCCQRAGVTCGVTCVACERRGTLRRMPIGSRIAASW